MVRALTLLSAITLGLVAGCVDIYRGAIVQFNLRRIDRSAPGEHYTLFAVVNGGAVPIAAFKVLSAARDCGQDPDLVADVDLVQRYDDGADRATLCGTDRRLGLVDKIDLATATLAGGVKVTTDVDLRDATSVFLSIEPDGDRDPAPDRVVMRAEIGDGVAPYRPQAIECRRDFCATLDPDDPDKPNDAMLFEQLCGDNIPTMPRARRGVRKGVLLRLPYADICAAVEAGEIAIVPAEDDTFL
ncbi:MAG: hypothetical protein KC583_17155 [Myxococcales bacterium]|nr:hypothetical protein [Myxococcales bacterium]